MPPLHELVPSHREARHAQHQPVPAEDARPGLAVRRAGDRGGEGVDAGGWIDDDPAQGDRLVAAVRNLRSEVANRRRLEELADGGGATVDKKQRYLNRLRHARETNRERAAARAASFVPKKRRRSSGAVTSQKLTRRSV